MVARCHDAVHPVLRSDGSISDCRRLTCYLRMSIGFDTMISNHISSVVRCPSTSPPHTLECLLQLLGQCASQNGNYIE
jgi:hypothetical protein